MDLREQLLRDKWQKNKPDKKKLRSSQERQNTIKDTGREFQKGNHQVKCYKKLRWKKKKRRGRSLDIVI